MPGTKPAYDTTQSPVLTRVCADAIPGTDVGYDGTRLCVLVLALPLCPFAIPGTERPDVNDAPTQSPVLTRVCAYAMAGTDGVYGATRWMCVRCYAMAGTDGVYGATRWR
eukprot:3748734-Rhodomonas_salina.1